MFSTLDSLNGVNVLNILHKILGYAKALKLLRVYK